MLNQLSALGAALLLCVVLGVGVGWWWDHRGLDDVFGKMFPSLQEQRDNAVLKEHQLTDALNDQTKALTTIAYRGQQIIEREGPVDTVYIHDLPAIGQKLKHLDTPTPPTTVLPSDDLLCAKMLGVDAQFRETLR